MIIRNFECLKIWMSESLNVWKSGCLKVWMSESLDVWKFECLDVWKFECMKVWMSESLYVWKFECPKVWMSESLNVWMSESLNVWKFECLRVWMSESLIVWKSGCLKVWTSESLNVWKSGCLKVWMSGCLKVWMSEGRLARKLRFQSLHICNLKEVSHEMLFCEIADPRHGIMCMKSIVSDDVWVSLSGGRVPDSPGHIRIMVGSAPQWNCQFKLCFHILNLQNIKEISHESFVYKVWTVGIWRASRTKASFSHLQLLEFERCLARKASFSHLQLLEFERCLARKLVFTPSTIGIWKLSRTKASFSYLQLLEFERCLARKLRFHIFNCWNLKEVFCVLQFSLRRSHAGA